MGKKSLLKSTSKKKNAKAKTDSDVEITPPVEASEVKSAPKKARGAKKQAVAKAKPVETKKSETKKEKPLSRGELLKKKFDIVVPDRLYVPPAVAAKAVEAPPFVSGLDAAETQRVRKLLFKTFDLSVPDPVLPEPEPVIAAVEKTPEPPAAPVSIAELLKRKFDIVAPTMLYVPPAAASRIIEAPPFVSGLEPAETERVRKLLFKTFDLSVPDPVPAEPEPIVPVVEEKAPEPVVEEKAPEPEVKVVEPEPAPEMAAIEPAAQTAPCPPEKSKRKFMEGLDPLIKKAIYAGCGLAAVFLLISIASFSNMSQYFLINKGDAVEVWQGRFAPLGTDRIAVLTGARMLKNTKSAYTRAEVSPLIIENYVRRADDLMVTKGVPDFEAIHTLLKDALSYAEGEEVRGNILQRLNRIEMTALVFKATISAGKESRSDLETAREYLTKAGWLAKEKSETEMIQQKLKAVNDKLSVPPPLKQSAPSKSPPSAAPAAH
jgi:hypothetical protein